MDVDWTDDQSPPKMCRFDVWFIVVWFFKEWLKRNALIHPIKQLNYWIPIVGITTKKMNLNSTTKNKNKNRKNIQSQSQLIVFVWFYLFTKWKKAKSILHSPESARNLRSVSSHCFGVAFAYFLFRRGGDTQPTACFVPRKVCMCKHYHLVECFFAWTWWENRE